MARGVGRRVAAWVAFVACAGERDRADRAQRFADGSRRMAMAIVNSDSCPSVFGDRAMAQLTRRD